MDIPSIKFRYFEKLKLWHDYLSPNSVFETQKKPYWDHEKMILLWAFTDLHGHLYTSVDSRRLFQIYNLQKVPIPDKNTQESEEDVKYHYVEYNGDFYKLKSKVAERYKWKMDELKEDIKNHTGKMGYIKGNLAAKGFAKAIYYEENKKDEGIKVPDRIRINSKGMLLGEILYESYCTNKFLKKDFKQYKWGYVGLILLILSAILIFISVFLKSVLFPIFDYIRLMNFIDAVCKISQ